MERVIIKDMLRYLSIVFLLTANLSFDFGAANSTAGKKNHGHIIKFKNYIY